MFLYPCNCITTTQQYLCCVDTVSPRSSFLRLTDLHPFCSSPHWFLGFFCILGCVFENPYTASFQWVIPLVTNVWIVFLSGSSLWSKRLPRCIWFLSVFVWWHASFVSFFNFLIFPSFCWFKNHKFVRRKRISFWILSNLCGSNLMLSFFFSGHKYLSLYDASCDLMFVC